MDKFASSMKEKYRDRLINREKQWPPRHSNKLVRLQLVYHKKGDYRSAIIQRGMEDKAVERTPLAYCDIFKEESGKQRVRKVLVEGDAGMGKTTLSISLSEDWACGKLFQEFELLLLLSLRQKEVATAASLQELVKLFHSSSRVCESVTSYFEEEEAKKVLIIADGWDESLPREESFIYQFLFKMFPLMSVVVTSRPSASARLHNLPCINRFVEVNGFNKDDIKEYIQSEFSSDQEKACRLLEQLEYNPLIGSTCSVPLNCAIVCHLWHTLEEALPSTMTQLYTKLILFVVCRNLRKLEAYGPTIGMASFDELPEGLQQSWSLLCQFACEALEKNKIVFSKKELIEFFPQGLACNDKILCFGLLQSADIVLDVTSEVSLNFLHLTFMEYLAALYLLRQPLDRKLKFLEKEKYDRSTTVSRFLFGLYFSNSQYVPGGFDVEQILKCIINAVPIKVLGSVPISHCALEAQNKSVTKKIIQLYHSSLCLDDNNVFFGYSKSAHDCAALLNVMGNVQDFDFIAIQFSNSGITDRQVNTLSNVLASRRGLLQVKFLDLSYNKLTDKSVSDVFCGAPGAFLSLRFLFLSGNSIGAKSIKSITTTLARSSFGECRLDLLSLCDNPLEVSSLQILEHAVRSNVFSNLSYLNLKGSLSSDAHTNASFVEALSTHCLLLEFLDLSRNNVGAPVATTLARVISSFQHKSQSNDSIRCMQPRFLSNMYLSQTNLGDTGLLAFVENLDDVCHIDRLEIDNNGISVTGISNLVETICSGKLVINELLDLSDNCLGLRGNEAIGKIISNSHCQLKSVFLSRCDLTTVGGVQNTDTLNIVSDLSIRDVEQQLCRMPHNKTITYLTLDGNNFSEEGILVLVGFLHLCTSLIVLSSRDCKITSEELKNLFDKLSQLKASQPDLCSQLEAWLLNDNEIDDSGARDLVHYAPSLFPSFCALRNTDESIDLSNNRLSSEMSESLKGMLRGHVLSFPSEYFHGDGSKVSLPVQLSPVVALPLDLSQCDDFKQENQNGSCEKVNAELDPESEEVVDMNVSTIVSLPQLQILDQVLDYESGGVSKHLGQIADIMYEWEGPVAEQLGLTPAEIAAIRMKHPRELGLQTRAALEKWKQKLGSSATYSNLIAAFELAGYQGYANDVKKICGNTSPLCTQKPQKSDTAALAIGKSSVAVKDSGGIHKKFVEKNTSCDQSNKVTSTPTSDLPPPAHCEDTELLDISCGSKRHISSPKSSMDKVFVFSTPPPDHELKDLEDLNAEGIDFDVEMEDFEAPKVEVDYEPHFHRKGALYSTLLSKSDDPNYCGLIKDLEAIGESKTAQQLRDKQFNV